MKSVATARIAFQGERGAFSEEAALKLLGDDITLVPCATFDATFSAIRDRAADYVLAPMENSLAGSVHRSFDLLVESGLRIVGEVIIPIVHNLIGVPGATFERVASVESHPVALAQCEQFFIENPRLKRIAAEDTAGSVREVMRAGDTTRAAIASKRAAELYDAAILREHLEDDRENYTRFFLLAPSAAEPHDARRRQNLARVPTRAQARCIASRAGALCSTQYQHDENRKPARCTVARGNTVFILTCRLRRRPRNCGRARRTRKAGGGTGSSGLVQIGRHATSGKIAESEEIR